MNRIDQHVELLMECIVNVFRPDPENSSYDREVSRASFNDIEMFLMFNLPQLYKTLVEPNGCLSNYLLRFVERDSVERNNVMGHFEQQTNMTLATDLMEYEGYESLVLLRNLENTTYNPSLDDPLEMELFKLYRDRAMKNICRRRLDLRNRLQMMLNQVFPDRGIEVEIFGSSANGLGTNNGDVDLCITEPCDRPRNDRRNWHFFDFYDMHYLRRLLINMGMENVTAIQETSVPICKFFDPITGLNGDINANAKLGIFNTRLIKEYTELDKRVGPFLFAIKFFAQNKGINNSPGKTLSSYAYYLLGLHYLMAVIDKPIIRSLQEQFDCSWNEWCNYHTGIRRVEGYNMRYHTCIELMENGKYYSPFGRRLTHTIMLTNNFDSLGTLIRGFFQFCAEGGLNIPSSIIRNDGKPIFPKNDKKGWFESSLIIQDPFIRSKNVARPCSEMGFQRIIQEFEKAADLLESGYTFQQVCQLA